MSYELAAILIASSIQIIILVITMSHFEKKFTQSDKIEFVKQLTYFEEKFNNIFDEYNNSPHYIGNCRRLADQWLNLLERLCFIFDKKIVNDDFMQFFFIRIDLGKRYLNWTQLIARDKQDVTDTFPYFLKHYSKFKMASEIDIQSNFINFFYIYRNLSIWDVSNDTTIVDDWVVPKEYRTSDYYELLHRDPLKLIKAIHDVPDSIYPYP